MIGLSYYKYVTKLVKKIKLNTTRILRMLVVFNIIFFTRFVTLTKTQKLLYESGIALFLCAEPFYFHKQHLFSCVNPLLLCYRVLNMSMVAIFVFTCVGHFYIFDRKFDKGHSHLTK